MSPENLRILIILAVIVIAVVVYTQVKKASNMRKAATGEDKELLKRLAAQALPGETDYQVVYGHWEDVQHYGRTTRTTYYTYILAYDTERLLVIPLGYEKGKPIPGRPGLVIKDYVGIANIDVTKDKEERTRRVSLDFKDKEGKQLLQVQVDATNLREDRFHHFNILQQEDVERFERFIRPFSDKVNQNAENVALKERLTDKANKQGAKSGLILGVLGIFLSWTVIIGLIFGGIGLLCAPWPKHTGGKPKAPFLTCCIALFLSLASLLMFILAISS